MRRSRALSDFIALYRGRTVAEAELVALSAEPRIVRRFFTELLGEPKSERTPEEADYSQRVPEAVRDRED